MATTAYKNRLMLFNDGEGVEEADWNDLQKLLTFRAWDAIGQYSRACQALGHPIHPTQSFSNRFSTPGTWGATTGGPIFVFGGDLVFTGLTTDTLTIGGGFFGRNGKTTRVANVPSMEWVYIDSDGGSPTFTVTANGGGGDRYDVLSVAFAETDETTESRDFKDGTTGQLSTTTPAKSRNLVATITLTDGIAGGAIATVPAGEHVLCWIKTASGAGAVIDDIFDWTYPINLVSVEQPTPAIQAIWGDMEGAASGDWERGGGGTIQSQVNGPTLLYLYPQSFGDPHARILGFELSYLFKAGTTIQLVTGSFGGTGNVAVESSIDITSLFILDASSHKTAVDLTNPNLLTTAPVNGRASFWCNGQHHKTDQAVQHTTAVLGSVGLFLRIDGDPAASLDAVLALSWAIAK